MPPSPHESPHDGSSEGSLLIEWELPEAGLGTALLFIHDLAGSGVEIVDHETLERPVSAGNAVVRIYTLPGSFQLAERIEDLADELVRQDLLPEKGRVVLREAAATDWVERYRESVEVQRFGDLYISPPWLIHQLEEEGVRDSSILILEPGQAFGTGQHATTALCLTALQELAAVCPRCKAFLDFGCGTGVLALAAVRLWPGLESIVATDIDPLALDAAEKNARLNGLEGRIEIIEPTLFVERFTAPLFDVLAANIQLDTLMVAAPSLLRLLRPGGIAVFSGLLSFNDGDGNEHSQAELLLSRLREHEPGLKLLDRTTKEEWTCLTVRCL